MKRHYIFVFVGIIAIAILQTNSLYAQKFIFGLKSGIAFSRVSSLDEIYSYSQDEGFPKYAYPPGFNAALFGEVKILDKLSLVTELSLLKITSQITITTTIESIPEKKYHGTYLHLSPLFKYQANWFFSPYFLMGIDMGYLIKAESKTFDLFDKRTDTFTLTNDLQPVDVSAALGFGREFKIFKKSFLWEAKVLLGLTEYESSEQGFLKSWRNNVLVLGFGIIL